MHFIHLMHNMTGLQLEWVPCTHIPGFKLDEDSGYRDCTKGVKVGEEGVGAAVFSSARAGQITEGHPEHSYTLLYTKESLPRTSALLCRAMKQASSP